MERARAIEVLIVDDEDRFRVTTTATLKKRGFRVKAAASGPEAIEEIRKGDVDVAVLDIKMPCMDGHETLREMRKLKPDIEVIMLTGYGSVGSAVSDRRQGVFAFLTKPCSIDFLAQRIREAYAKKGGVSEYNRKAGDIMVPLSAFVSRIHEDQSVADAVDMLLRFLDAAMRGARLQETLHRSILVVDDSERAVGVIDLSDLLRSLEQPCIHLMEKEPMLSDSVYLEASTCMGGFATMVREKSQQAVRELLPSTPLTIDEGADLMEATEKMLSLNAGHLLVLRTNEPVGVLREKDLFLEMAKIVRERRQAGDEGFRTGKAVTETVNR